MKRAKIIGVGTIYMDINAANFPFDNYNDKLETDIIGDDYEVMGGGSAVNFSRLCAALGLAPIFIGKVGTDFVGRLLPEILLQEGVEPRLIVDPQVKTNIALNMANASDDMLAMAVGTANQSLSADEVYDKIVPLLDGTTYLYLGGCLKLKRLLPAYERLVDVARAKGVKIIIDHGRIATSVTTEERAHVKNLVRHADYYLPSRDELCDLWSVDSIEEGLRLLKAVQTVVKDSRRGAWTLKDGMVVNIPSFPTKAHHVVGAGDSFNAGLIVAQHEGKDIEQSIRFACATAVLYISRRKTPTYKEVGDFLKNNKEDL